MYSPGLEGGKLHRLVTVLIASVWIGFGLLCKVLHFVPRHEEIVARILGEAHAGLMTRGIGMLEMLLGLWVLTGLKKRLTAIVQMTLVGTMNVLETLLAPDLLLWGRFNALFAVAFISVIYVNEWVLVERPKDATL